MSNCCLIQLVFLIVELNNARDSLLALNITVQGITEFTSIKILQHAIKDLSIYLAIRTNRSKIHHQWVENFNIQTINFWLLCIYTQSKGTPANLGTSTLTPAARVDVRTDPSGLWGYSSLEWAGTGTTVTAAECYLKMHWIFPRAASQLLWKPGGNEQLRAVWGCPLLREGNHSRGFISLCLSPGSLAVMVWHSHSSFLLPA